MNREMLKEAIAEAKTIKETAIANAKLALEEAFTPQLTAMFAEKLNELDEEEEIEESVNEMNSEEDIDENFNIDEILAELEMTDENYEVEEGDMEEGLDEDLTLEEMSDEQMEELVTQVIDDMIASGKLMAGEETEEEESEEEEMEMDDMEMGAEEDSEESEEEIDLDEMIAEMESEEKIDEVGYVDPNSADLIVQVADYLNTSKDAIMAMLAALPATVAASGFLKGVLKGKKIAKSMEEVDTKEMEETINELRDELNEVNLLNAKLLYTNKIFKAKNLTESDKVKVLNAFDKAENVKGVKLVYETLTESLKTISKPQIKESLGSASRTLAPAAKSQPIVEVNEAFTRMQRLAGIKK